MKKMTIALLLSAFSVTGFSALPPRYQGPKDIKKIFSLLEGTEYRDLALGNFKSLTKINGSFELVYNDFYNQETCTVLFGREERQKSFGWVGPAASLEIKEGPVCVEMK